MQVHLPIWATKSARSCPGDGSHLLRFEQTLMLPHILGRAHEIRFLAKGFKENDEPVQVIGEPEIHYRLAEKAKGN